MAETHLATLIRSMRPRLVSGRFVFVAIPAGASMPSGTAPVMTFQEVEGTTLIMLAEQASSAGLTAAFPCRIITLDINSSLEAVGFLAAITARLAAAGIAVNPVSAFHHDHLFVPEERADEAMAILKAMTEEGN
jgi:hypothetical protein